ncbi:MAG: hypothetical protein WCP58_03125 [bacterium]
MNSPPVSLSIPRQEKGVLARMARMAEKMIARGDLHRAEGVDRRSVHTTPDARIKLKRLYPTL